MQDFVRPLVRQDGAGFSYQDLYDYTRSLARLGRILFMMDLDEVVIKKIS